MSNNPFPQEESIISNHKNFLSVENTDDLQITPLRKEEFNELNQTVDQKNTDNKYRDGSHLFKPSNQKSLRSSIKIKQDIGKQDRNDKQNVSLDNSQAINVVHFKEPNDKKVRSVNKKIIDKKIMSGSKTRTSYEWNLKMDIARQNNSSVSQEAFEKNGSVLRHGQRFKTINLFSQK